MGCEQVVIRGSSVHHWRQNAESSPRAASALAALMPLQLGGVSQSWSRSCAASLTSRAGRSEPSADSHGLVSGSSSGCSASTRQSDHGTTSKGSPAEMSRVQKRPRSPPPSGSPRRTLLNTPCSRASCANAALCSSAAWSPTMSASIRPTTRLRLSDLLDLSDLGHMTYLLKNERGKETNQGRGTANQHKPRRGKHPHLSRRGTT